MGRIQPVSTLLLICWATSAQPASIRRLAILVGNDEGGSRTRPLLYAQSDAQRIHRILLRIGGVAPEDAVLLLDRGGDELIQALEEAEGKAKAAKAAGQKTALFVYYSGHARDGALRLGGTAFSFEALKQRLSRSAADVRVGIIDACRSGELTRTKGARRAPQFDIEAQGGPEAQGTILLTSSAADEDSQESDQIGGSYFSHYFASGLMGDADRSGDGKVTLAEAYAYAYARTVADTADSASGAQHPTFSYELSGNGDLVLTDLRQLTEGLGFPARTPNGLYYLVDGAGMVAAEVLKADEVEHRIALAPGTYRIKRRLADRLRIAELEVTPGNVTWVEESAFHDAPFSDDPVKGGTETLHGTVYSLGALAGYQSFFDRPTRDALFPPSPMIGVEVRLPHFFRRHWALGWDAAFGGGQGSVALPGLLAPFHSSQLTVGTFVVDEWQRGRWAPYWGARFALMTLFRHFDDPRIPGQYFITWSPGLVVGAKARIAESWALGASAKAHYLLYNADSSSQSLGYWELGAMVTHDL